MADLSADVVPSSWRFNYGGVLGARLSHWWQWLGFGLWALLALTATAYLAQGVFGLLPHGGCAGHDSRRCQRCRESWPEARNAGVVLLFMAAVPVVLLLAVL